MSSRKILVIIGFVLAVALAWSHTLGAQGAPGTPTPADPWPRELKLSNATVLVYQPQINSWEGNISGVL
jgi:hypothetical protein